MGKENGEERKDLTFLWSKGNEMGNGNRKVMKGEIERKRKEERSLGSFLIAFNLAGGSIWKADHDEYRVQK